MSTHRNIDIICVAVLVFAILLTVLFMNGSSLGIEMIIDEDAEIHSDSVFFTSNDLDGAWNAEGATVISLNGDSAKITGNGAYYYNGNVVISNAGKYLLCGTLEDGSIVVDAYRSSKVWLLLDGVNLFCSDDACLRVDQAEKVFLTLAEGSENSMTSGTTYSADALSDRTGGAIFSHDDLTINGSGSLIITAAYKHGIDANDEFVITGGAISITAPEDAIHANDSVRLQGMDLTISAGDDGIHCDDDIVITGGKILITDCYEGIEGLTIDVQGGEITIFPRDDGFNANGNSNPFGFGFGPGGSSGSETAELQETWLHISGGMILIVNDSARDADGLDSNGDIVITGGSIRVSLVNSGSNSALDCGSENGGRMEIAGGDIVAAGSYMMAEGFDASSAQCSILYNISSGVDAGTPIYLEDKEGNELLGFEVPCSFSSVVLSCPEMKIGETYLLVIGERAEEITLDEVSASFGDAQSTMFGGPMNWGGMRDRESFGGGGFPDGRSRGRGRNNAENAESNREEPPSFPPGLKGEMPSAGQMPPPPDINGEIPDMGTRPAPPDFSGEMPDRNSMSQPPDPNEETSDRNEPAAPSDYDFSGIQIQEFSDQHSLTEETASNDDPSAVRFQIAICTEVLLLAILFAKIFRKNN